jgi:thiamine pyrophosphokinase
MPNRIIILANGELPNLERARALLRPTDLILCADGGTRHALALGVQPYLIIGDMDSTEAGVLETFQHAGAQIEAHPRDKNETDLELAIARAVELDPQEIIIMAALGGRMDQTLANIALLSSLRRLSPITRMDDGVEEIFFVMHQAHIEGRSGDVVSLIPWGVPVHGVWTQNLRWPLNGETLHPDHTLGISNEMTSNTAEVKAEAGQLLVVHRRQF